MEKCEPPALRFPPFLSHNRCTGKLEETGRGLEQQADTASEVKTVECSAGGAGCTLMETKVRRQSLGHASSGRQKNGRTAAKWLRQGGSSMMRRHSMESGSDGPNSRLTGTMGRKSGQGLGCTMRRGGCGRTGREREGFGFTDVRRKMAVGLQLARLLGGS